MQNLVQGEVSLHFYGQMYAYSRHGDFPVAWGAMGGQQNGICGAATAGALVLMTGCHSDKVPVTVELHDAEPQVEGDWEEIVEVSFRPLGEVSLASFNFVECWTLHLSDIDYRVRYCASALDWDYKNGEALTDRVRATRLLLQFWPGAPRPDKIVRQTTQAAARSHEYARKEPPPPTPEQKAEAERQAEAARYEEHRQLVLKQDTDRWGGRLPSDRIRALGSIALNVAGQDRGLVEALDAATDEDQARVARWIARRALTEAGLVALPWIAEALTAAEAGEDLPPLFQDNHEAWTRLRSDPAVPATVVTSLDGLHNNFSQQTAALPALLDLKHEDPLKSAFLVFSAAAVTFGRGRTAELITGIRQAFPGIFASYASHALIPNAPSGADATTTGAQINIVHGIR